MGRKRLFENPTNYDQKLIERLKNLKHASGYLKEIIDTCSKEGDDVETRISLICEGLRYVVEAQGGVYVIAEKAEVHTDTLYKMLAQDGNPTLRTLSKLLYALGLNETFDIIARSKGRRAG